MKIFNAELLKCFKKNFKITWKKNQEHTKKIWIFSNNQAAIKKLHNLSLKAS